jgi:hypothetical protein
LEDPPKFTQIGIFGLKIYRLATLDVTSTLKFGASLQELKRGETVLLMALLLTLLRTILRACQKISLISTDPNDSICKALAGARFLKQNSDPELAKLARLR